MKTAFVVDNWNPMSDLSGAAYLAGIANIVEFKNTEDAYREFKASSKKPALLITGYLVDGRGRTGLQLIEDCKLIEPKLHAVLVTGLGKADFSEIEARAQKIADRVLAYEKGATIAAIVAEIKSLEGI